MTSVNTISALLDANILYSAILRDIFMEVALAKLYLPLWTNRIHEEWMSALHRNKPHLAIDQIERTRALMEVALPKALVRGYETVIGALTLPDPDDRHVLAAAIVSHCDVIVTLNLRDFPAAILARHNLKAQHPDEFLLERLYKMPDEFCLAVRTARVTKSRPSYTVEEYLAALEGVELRATAAALRQYARLLK